MSRNRPRQEGVELRVNLTPENRQTILLKEIDLAQDIIRRMASNSFMIKGWTVTLIVVALLLQGQARAHAFLAFIPLLVFWGLDAYFLRQERLYRELYTWIVQSRPTCDDYLFDLRTTRFADTVDSVPAVMVSPTLGWFYGALFVLVICYAATVFVALT